MGKKTLALAAPGMAHLLLLAAAFALCGIGATPDSTYYVSAALNLKAGLGFSSSILPWDARAQALPLATWPPIYPILLALWPGASMEAAARWLNLAFVLSNTWILAWIVHRQGRGLSAAALAGAAMAVSPAMFLVHDSVFSEPPFLFFLLLGLFCQERIILTGKLSWLLAGAAAIAAASMTRYIGVAAIACGVLAIAAGGVGGRGHRLSSAALFGASASLPLGLWLLRNVRLTGTMTGHRGVCVYTWTKAAWDAVSSLAYWFLPSFLPARAAAFLFLGLLAGALAILGRTWSQGGLQEGDFHGGPYSAFIPAYLVLTTAIFLTAQVDWLHSRYLAPIFPAVLALAALAGARLRFGFRTRIAAALVFLVFPALNTARDVAYLRLRAQGVGYGAKKWRQADIIIAAKKGAPPFAGAGPVFSNTADVLLYYSGRPCHYLPERLGDPGKILAALHKSLGKGGIIVYAAMRDSRSNLIPESMIAASSLFVLKKEFAKGKVYAPVRPHGR
ncbi:MAG: phospholipid carrier-dependent glycosyltransferase [Elusimicrobia bacterium]|nr:phospholipid carrier-dependent glycosyltransferase [Elusimicrobiota bacterium]